MKHITGYQRDASWFDRPDTVRPKKLHRQKIINGEGTERASCSNMILLIIDNPINVYPNSPMLCKKCFKTPTV
jgi:hypothetical protein